MSLFADDALVAVSSDNINDLSTIANDVIHCMKNYCEYTGFILNDLKTDLILCSPRKLDESILIKVNCRSIKQSAQVKFLGLYMDSHLTWSSQIDIILKKLSTSCFVLWQLRSYVTTDILITYYYAYVYSTLNFGIICWGNSTRVSEVLILQKRILRTMTFKSSKFSCRDLFK